MWVTVYGDDAVGRAEDLCWDLESSGLEFIRGHDLRVQVGKIELKYPKCRTKSTLRDYFGSYRQDIPERRWLTERTR